MDTIEHLAALCKRIRFNILTSTTIAGSGHPTSCLSAVELMGTLYFGEILRQDLVHPHSPLNDRVIFSKGHAAPLLYSLYEAAGYLTHRQLVTLRSFASPLQGHPTPEFPFADTATGSLGQGLSNGVGLALGIRLMVNQGKIHMRREPTVWVLLGDSEMAEGQIWEAMETASHNNLNNLVAILDINRLGQSGETGHSWNVETYRKRAEAFGWRTITLNNGHNLEQVYRALKNANSLNTIHRQKPLIILAKTVKGKGVPFLEDRENWHGKPVPQNRLHEAIASLGEMDFNKKGTILAPDGAITTYNPKEQAILWRLEKIIDAGSTETHIVPAASKLDKTLPLATREAFGNALRELGGKHTTIVALDAEVGNSTYLEKFGTAYPDRYFQMFIDEENMVSCALGLAKAGFTPFVSTFAAFLTRAHDQIRMLQYSLRRIRKQKTPNESVPDITVNIVGSHAGVSIGQDGPSQMGLEDIAMMRSVPGATVLYPCDGVSAAKLTAQMVGQKGINYMRTTRQKTPNVYDTSTEFPIGKFKILRQSEKDVALIIAAGITLHEALKAYELLKKQRIPVAVVDLYCIAPLDADALYALAKSRRHVIVVEDHYEAGGMGEAVLTALTSNGRRLGVNTQFSHLCVRKTPRSGTPEELLRYEEIDAQAIVEAIQNAGP
jgi:transketolase